VTRRGIPFVVSGPSGVGKSTIVRQVVANDPGIHFSVSHTTRKPRAGEKDGVDYFFVDRPQFQKEIAAGSFLEHAEYQGNLYGTSKKAVEIPTREGYDLILEVEIQGAQQLRERLSEAVRIFIEPPSFEILEDRLRKRSTETDAAMRARLARAREELAYAVECHHRIVNESVDKAVAEFLDIVAKARRERG